MADNDEWIDAHAAATILKVSERQVNNHGNSNPPRLRTQRIGRRVLYYKSDVETLAVELRVDERPRPKSPPKAEMIAMSEVLSYIQQTQRELSTAMLEIGRLQAQLEAQRLLTQDAQDLRSKLAAAEARADELQRQLDLERNRNR